MLGKQIEAVFENGIFRPLQPVHLPEHQRVMLVLPPTEEVATDPMSADDDDFHEDVEYEPLPLAQVTTIRVRLKCIGDLGPLPYPVEADDLEEE